MPIDPAIESQGRALAARLLRDAGTITGAGHVHARFHGVDRVGRARTLLAEVVRDHARSLDYDPDLSAVHGRAAAHLQHLLDRAVRLPGAGQRAAELNDVAAPLVVEPARPRSARARWEARPSLVGGDAVCVEFKGGRTLTKEDKRTQEAIWSLSKDRRAAQDIENRIRSTVAQLRVAGVSWTVIGDQLGITRQAAMKRYASDALPL